MIIKEIKLNWNENYSIFAKDDFLKYACENKNNEYGYLGGYENNELLFVLPYIIKNRLIFHYIQFQTATIKIKESNLEKEFLNKVIKYLAYKKIDFVASPPVSALFDNYPDKSIKCKFGSYVIDLALSEDELWQNLHGKHRNVIRKAMKNNLTIKQNDWEESYNIFNNTLSRSKMKFISKVDFLNQYKDKDYVKLYSIYKDDKIQGAVLILYSKYKSYYLYGGSTDNIVLGAMNLLHWELIKILKNEGVKKYDFLGARLCPPKKSKLEGIQRFKSRFGTKMQIGYLWKYNINPIKSFIYSTLLKILAYKNRRKFIGDIIEQEKNNFNI